MKNPKWGVRDTAKYFNMAYGPVSECIQVAQAIKKDPSYNHCPNMVQALIKLRSSK